MRINEKTLIAYANSSSTSDREGYLMKKGEVNRGYQKRWFVLKGNLLFYYEKKVDKEPAGVIVLEECTIECFDSSEGFAFMINFRGPNTRTYVLSSDNQEDMEAWMKALSCASYEYMRLLVSDLQRKLDEVNRGETSKLINMGDRASNAVSKAYDVFSPRSNGVDIAEEALISFGNNSSASDSQTSTPTTRSNPFASESLVDVDSSPKPLPGPPKQLRKAHSMPQRTPRTFSKMHEEFGQLISLHVENGEDNASKSDPVAKRRPPRNQPQSLSLDLQRS